MKSWAVAAWILIAWTSFAACGGSTTVATPVFDAGGPTTPDDDGGMDDDAAAPSDATADAGPPVFPDDGTPTRVACVSTYGKGISPVHGRLDGVLVSIVDKSFGACNADSTHVHLQVSMNGGIYDIAVNIDGYEAEVDAALPGGAYAEGWHPMLLDYVTDLGVHSTAITLTGIPVVRARILEQLTNANHISVFGTGYDDMTGAHLIHYDQDAHDGALVLDPLSAKPHFLVFRFEQDSF